jgi:hypothetical protein
MCAKSCARRSALKSERVEVAIIFSAKTAAVIMCPSYESHNVCETRAEDFYANDGDFVDVILLYFPQLLNLDCLKFLRLQSLPYRKHSLSELQRSIMGRQI